METTLTDAPPVVEKQLNPFERYLTVWVALCMVAGVVIGQVAPGLVHTLRTMEFGQGRHINLPIAVLIWLMIVPMMMKVDFASIRHVGARPTGLVITLFVNWVVKPFSMACFAWLFFRVVFAAWITPAEADQYIAGAIILAAAPCTAMVFVWSYLTDGDPAYTLVQVSVNNLIMLVLFAPIVGLLVSGASSLTVPFDVLLYSVLAFIVIPLAIGWGLRAWLVRQQGQRWVEDVLLPRFAPGHHRGPAPHLGLHLRLPGPEHHGQDRACSVDRGAHPPSSVSECVIGLWAHASVSRAPCDRGAGRVDRGRQLFVRPAWALTRRCKSSGNLVAGTQGNRKAGAARPTLKEAGNEPARRRTGIGYEA